MGLFFHTIHSPLGDIIALADNIHLVLLEFSNSDELDIKKIKLENVYWKILHSANDILEKTEQELKEYFEWKRKIFSIPTKLTGTEFQVKAWKWLEKIPYGETRNYLEQAIMIEHPKAVRAIGWANHNNPIVIIIPCHRVIWKSGKLVGYGGWLDRKKWLLDHEKKYKKDQMKINNFIFLLPYISDFASYFCEF